MTDTDQDRLIARIRDHLDQNSARVSSLMVDGTRVWLKRVERHGPIRRLQKGDPAAAFKRERAALRDLAGRGLPVAQLIAEGNDWFAIADCGTVLDHILRKSSRPPQERSAIFTAAGQALAQLHRAGISHGRPNLKDICWDGDQIRFLDFERYAALRNTQTGHIQDLLMFIFSTIVVNGDPCAELDSAVSAYRAQSNPEIWTGAKTLARKLRWLIPLTAPVRALTGSQEFHAFPKAIDYILTRD